MLSQTCTKSLKRGDVYRTGILIQVSTGNVHQNTEQYYIKIHWIGVSHSTHVPG